MLGPLDDAVIRLVGDLSVTHGWSWATERGLRDELERRTGRRVGERSIGRVLRRLVKTGAIAHRRILPGGRMANGMRTSHGTQHNRHIPRWLQRAERKRERRRLERQARIERQRTDAEAAAARKRADDSARARASERQERAERVQLSAEEQAEVQGYIAGGDFVQLALFWKNRAKPPPE